MDIQSLSYGGVTVETKSGAICGTSYHLWIRSRWSFHYSEAFLMLFFYWQRIWPGSILWLRGSSSVRVTQQSPVASEPITMKWKYHTILQLTWTPQWTIDLCRSTWFSNFQQPQLSITAEGKRQNSVTVIVPRKEYDTQGAINDQTIPWHRTSFLVYRSLCCVCAVAFMWKQIYGC